MDAFNRYMNGHIVGVSIGKGLVQWKEGTGNGVLSKALFEEANNSFTVEVVKCPKKLQSFVQLSSKSSKDVVDLNK